MNNDLSPQMRGLIFGLREKRVLVQVKDHHPSYRWKMKKPLFKNGLGTWVSRNTIRALVKRDLIEIGKLDTQTGHRPVTLTKADQEVNL